jgi:hypothetical protein
VTYVPKTTRAAATSSRLSARVIYMAMVRRPRAECRRSDEGKQGRRSDEGKQGRRSDEGKQGRRSDEGKQGRRSDEGRIAVTCVRVCVSQSARW